VQVRGVECSRRSECKATPRSDQPPGSRRLVRHAACANRIPTRMYSIEELNGFSIHPTTYSSTHLSMLYALTQTFCTQNSCSEIQRGQPHHEQRGIPLLLHSDARLLSAW
jgi:hypothetical protein